MPIQDWLHNIRKVIASLQKRIYKQGLMQGNAILIWIVCIMAETKKTSNVISVWR